MVSLNHLTATFPRQHGLLKEVEKQTYGPDHQVINDVTGQHRKTKNACCVNATGSL